MQMAQSDDRAQRPMTFLGLDLETSARYAGLATVLLTIAAALVGYFAWKWNDEAQSIEARRALSAETELETLKRKLAPREMAQPMFDQLVELLRQAEPKGAVRVGWCNNSECAAYGSRFAAALRAAGWSADTTIMLDMNGHGVFVVIQDQKKAAPHAAPLLKALIGANIEATGLEHEQLGSGAEVSLLIAEKP